MKRIENACLEQTLLFSQKEKMNPDADLRINRQEFSAYKLQMDGKRMAYQVLAEEEMEDGSLRIRIRRQYNTYPCDQYLV